MTILNESSVTKAIQDLFRKNLSGYMIERNEPENEDPSRARQNGSGWIGIYTGATTYTAATIGRTPWTVIVSPKIVVQVVSLLSGIDAEEKLEKSIYDIITLLTANKTLSNTVYMTNGFSLEEPMRSEREDFHFYKRTITLNCEIRC